MQGLRSRAYCGVGSRGGQRGVLDAYRMASMLHEPSAQAGQQQDEIPSGGQQAEATENPAGQGEVIGALPQNETQQMEVKGADPPQLELASTRHALIHFLPATNRLALAAARSSDRLARRHAHDVRKNQYSTGAPTNRTC